LSLKVFLGLIGLFLLAGCDAQPQPLPIPIDTTTVLGNSTSLPDPLPGTSIAVPTDFLINKTPETRIPTQTSPAAGESTLTAPRSVPAHYVLEAELDYFQHTLSVNEAITYVNYSPEALNDLILMVEPNRWQGGFTLQSLTWGDGESIEEYELNDDQMHISLPRPLKSGDSLHMMISYLLEIPQIAPPSETYRPQPYGYTDRQTNIVDWYPYIPPYRSGEGWLVHKHWWFGEHQVYDVAEYIVRLTLAEAVQDLVIAASTPAELHENSYTYYLDAGRSFALSASTEYLVQTTTAGGVTIYSYSFSYDKYAAQEVLHNTADAMQLFSQLITPYPHASLSVVEADFLDGMEYEGLYFLSNGFYNLYDGTPRGYLTFIAAHETAHQWWYGLVGNDQAIEPWLDESLCTYMEHIFYENIYADYPPDSGQSMVDWWWYYRVNYYDPAGRIDGSIYDFDSFRSYRDAVYLNGANFLDDLRNLVGDRTFFAFLQDYVLRYEYKIATSADFFTVLRENTSKNIDGLVAEYFEIGR